MLCLEHAQCWASECPDVKNYKRRLNPVWHRMLYSCTHTATVGINGLTDIEPCWRVYPCTDPHRVTLGQLHSHFYGFDPIRHCRPLASLTVRCGQGRNEIKSIAEAWSNADRMRHKPRQQLRTSCCRNRLHQQHPCTHLIVNVCTLHIHKLSYRWQTELLH